MTWWNKWKSSTIHVCNSTKARFGRDRSSRQHSCLTVRVEDLIIMIFHYHLHEMKGKGETSTSALYCCCASRILSCQVQGKPAATSVVLKSCSTLQSWFDGRHHNCSWLFFFFFLFETKEKRMNPFCWGWSPVRFIISQSSFWNNRTRRGWK